MKISTAVSRLKKTRQAVGDYITTFAAFESIILPALMGFLSHDQELVRYLPEVTDLRARLKVLMQLAKVRRVPKPIVQRLKKLCDDAGEYSKVRNRVAHISTEFALDVRWL